MKQIVDLFGIMTNGDYLQIKCIKDEPDRAFQNTYPETTLRNVHCEELCWRARLETALINSRSDERLLQWLRADDTATVDDVGVEKGFCK